MVNYVIAKDEGTAKFAAKVRGLDDWRFLENSRDSADRLRGMSNGHILVTNLKLKKPLFTQLRLIDRGVITFDWVAI